MEKKRFYFKLGGVHTSVFSDHMNGLKITRNIPGSTFKPESKATKEATSNGHIVEISKQEFDNMMSKITPEERKMAYQEQSMEEEVSTDVISTSESDQEESTDPEKEALLIRLKRIKLTKSKRDEVSQLETAELKAFIEAEEGK